MTEDEDSDLPPKTHNNPPIEEILAQEFEKYIAKLDKLLLETAAITAVESEEEATDLIEVAKRVGTAITTNEEKKLARTEELRETVKKINAWFIELGNKPIAEKARLIGVLDVYKAKKREAEAKIAAERAERAAEEARIRNEASKEAGGVVGEVLQKEAEKRQAESDMSRRHALGGTSGPMKTSAGTASERKTVKHKITDWKKIPLAKLKGHFDTKALDGAVKNYIAAHRKVDKETLPELAGVEFYFDNQTVLR